MKKRIILIVLILVVAVLVAGSVWFVNEFLPKAPPMEDHLPTAAVTKTVRLSVNHGNSFEVDVNIEELLAYMSEAVPTRIQSMNDYPSERPFYTIQIDTITDSPISSWYHLYESGTEVYLEISYGGVYTVDRELWDLVTAYFQE